MDNSDSGRNPVEELAEEFVARYRRGERPALSEYTNRYPDWADKIRVLFPALVVMEQARPGPAEAARPQGLYPGECQAERLGDYRILREVGRGGMGRVYEAEQESLGRHVALKVLSAHALPDTRQLQRFKREARAAARLHHTNIVPVHGVGEQDGVHYYVMQFIRGQGLDQVLAELRRLRRARLASVAHRAEASPAQATDPPPDSSAAAVAWSLLSGRFLADPPSGASNITSGSEVHDHGVLPASAEENGTSSTSVHLPGQAEGSSLSEAGWQYWQSVARIGIQVADALAYAASQGILHRDIKPSNLLLDTRGTVWVTDFGLAKADTDHDSLTVTGDIVGTLRYMAPERFQGQGDARSDLYALGLTLYELLTFRPAFHAGDRNKLVVQVMHDDLPRPRKLNPAVPRDLETIVLKATARDPGQRYQTPTEMAEDLQRFLDDRPIKARRLRLDQRFARWCRRSPVVAFLVGFLVVSLLAGIGISSFFAIRADRKATEAAAFAKQARREQRRSEQRLYVASINLTHQAWKDGETGLVLQRLAEWVPKSPEAQDLRGFEWRYLHRLCRLELATLHGHTGPVTAVAYSPDGLHLASASEDHTVRLWDIPNEREALVLRGHTGMVRAIAFNPDGSRLASAGEDKQVKLWNARTGRELLSLEGRTAFHGVAFSPDGRRVAGCGWEENFLPGTITIWDADDGRRITSLPSAYAVADVAFSPDGRRVASGSSDGIIRVWEADTGREAFTLKGHFNHVWKLAFSPDGQRLASAGWDQTVRIWDLRARQEAFTLRGHSYFVSGVAFSPDGQRLASASWDGTMKIWDLTDRREILTHRGHTQAMGGSSQFSGHAAGVTAVAFSPDGRCVATSGADRTVRIWDASRTGEALVLTGHTNHVDGLAFSPDGRRLASAGLDQQIKVWDTATGAELLSWPAAGIVCVAFSPDGQRLASAGRDNAVTMWSSESGHKMTELRGLSNLVHCVAFSPDGRYVAAGQDGQPPILAVWDASSGQEVRIWTAHAPIWAVAYSSDGRYIASGSDDGTVQIWNAATGREIRNLQSHGNRVSYVTFSPNGSRLATASWDRNVKVWDTASGECLATLRGHTAWVQAAAFSPDGRRLASVGADRTWKIWDMTTFHLLLSVPAHEAEVVGVAFSPDGLHLATSSWDHTIKIWDATQPTLESAQQRQARSVVDFLSGQTLSGDRLLARIRTDRTLSEPVRARALGLVK